ncbi:hypothetical protein F4820DRAFT_469259 [Hypoxylon rubiginosum]|uniref:Uncharacterized protein n=1 Tax=Hypoxylon rubiginosum TaxID=110542 RepID=A0ACB9Z344_9PEZI|nr:hypothetical protein F4820DRAFT_469259 [Hypoxylon rubiginosum]
MHVKQQRAHMDGSIHSQHRAKTMEPIPSTLPEEVRPKDKKNEDTLHKVDRCWRTFYMVLMIWFLCDNILYYNDVVVYSILAVGYQCKTGLHSANISSTRTRSRSGAFLDALGSGRLGDAIGALKPGSDPNSGDRHQHQHHRRRRHGDEYYHYDDDDDEDDGYYYHEDARPRRRHRSTHTADRHGRSRASRQSASTGPDLRQAAEAAAAAGIVEAWRSRCDGDRAATGRGRSTSSRA